MIDLVATDLDGTLLAEHEVLTERAKQALQLARSAGAVTVAATGRSQFTGVPIVGRNVDWMICSNGATLFDPHEDTVVERLVLDDDLVQDIGNIILADEPEATFGWEVEDGFLWDENWSRIIYGGFDKVKNRRVIQPGQSPTAVSKILIGLPRVTVPGTVTQTSVDLVGRWGPLLPDGVYVSASGAPFVEMTDARANKGDALARLCERLGIDQTKTVAFGDNINDLTMLEWAGRSYAMADAAPDIKAAADEVAPANHEEGVAQIIERLFAADR